MVVRLIGIAIVVLVLGSVAAVAPAVAADAPAQVIGMVDVPTVFNDYEKTKKSQADLKALEGQLTQQLQTLSENKLLEDGERKELGDLVVKENSTDKDKERVKALQEREKTLDGELKDLQSKKEPTEAEKTRLKELQDKSAKADESIAKLGDSFKDQLAQKSDAMSQQLRDDILKAISAVAAEKKMTVVVDKVAVLFGGADITQAVLEQLNGKKK